MRRALPFVAHLVLLAPVTARAAEGAPATCALAPAETPIESHPFSLFPRRHFELWVLARVALDWNGGNTHGAWGPGAELALTDDAQRFRLGAWFAWPMMGHYGDSTHQWLSFEGGLTFRGTVIREELFDVYLAAQGSAMVTWSPADGGARGAARIGPGLGMRFARHVQVEAFGQPTFAFADAFVEGNTKATMGLVLQFGFDTCALGSWCEPSERKPREEDLTCRLYQRAHQACVATTDATEQGTLCAAVDASLDAAELEDARAPDDPADSTELFLRAVAQKLPPASALRARIEGLRVAHGALTAEWHEAHEQARTWRAEEPPRRSPIDCRYSAYATELRTLLGCGPLSAATGASASAPRCPAPACR